MPLDSESPAMTMASTRKLPTRSMGLAPFDPSRSPSVEAITAAFSARWKAEGVSTPFRLPADYLSMDYKDQLVCLINLEREAAGVPALRRSTGDLQKVAQKLIDNGSRAHDGMTARYDAYPSTTGARTDEALACAWSAAGTVWAHMYDDGAHGWGHRKSLLSPNSAWVGVATVPFTWKGAEKRPGTFDVLDFASADY